MDFEQLIKNIKTLTHGLSTGQEERLGAALSLSISGRKAINVEEVMANIIGTVEDLTNDQQAAIHNALIMATQNEEEDDDEVMSFYADDEDVDELVEEVMAELEEEDDDEMSYFMEEEDDDDEVSSYFADDEDEEELMSILAEIEDDEELMFEDDDEEEFLSMVPPDDDDELMFGEDDDEDSMAEGDEELEDTIRATIRSILRKPRRKSRRSRKSVSVKGSRPPYSFVTTSKSKDTNRAVKVINTMRFGETSSAVKAVAADLYGDNYDELRHEQHIAFATYIRRGERGLNNEHRSALKRIVLAPSQIEYVVRQGIAVKSIKTDMSEVLLDLGGFLVPEDFRTDLIERLPGLTVVRAHATVGPTGSDVMTRVKVTGGDDRYTSAVRTSWVGDAPTASARTAPTFGLERTPIHIQKATIYVPMSLLEDTPFPLTQWVSDEVSKAYAIDEDETFLIGNGIAKPEGILPGSANTVLGAGQEVVSGNATALTADGIIDLVYGLAQQYWPNALYVMNRTTAGIIRKFKDGEGRYLWEDSYQKGQPAQLLGYPVYTSEAMPDVAANAYPIIFGDFKGYSIADRIGMSVVRDEITLNEDDIIKFLFRRRLGAQVNMEWAFTVQKVSA